MAQRIEPGFLLSSTASSPTKAVLFPTGYTGVDWGEVSGGEVVELIRDMTSGRGADVCIDAVGFEPDRNLLDRTKAIVNLERGSIKVLEACLSAVRRGGIVPILGVYPTTYDNFPLGQIFDKGVIVKAGQAPVHKHIDTLLGYVSEGRVVLDPRIH